VLSIDGMPFTSLPDTITLMWSPNDASGEQGEKFRSNQLYTLFDPEYADDIRAVKALEGRSAVVNSYVVSRGQPGFRDILLEEVLFQMGDTIRFKGRVENGRIVPLY